MTPEQFEQKVAAARQPLVVEFWAPWCGPCKIMNPILKSASEKYRGQVELLKINADESPELLRQLKIFSIPTLLVYRDGKAVYRKVGAQPAAAIEALFAGLAEGKEIQKSGPTPFDRLLRLGAGAASRSPVSPAGSGGLLWLNPGADRRLRPGEQVILRYRLPARCVRPGEKPRCIGQKQVWFLLRLLCGEEALRLDATPKPEFDRFRWVDYWYPVEHVVAFRREVYARALGHMAPAARQVAGGQQRAQARAFAHEAEAEDQEDQKRAEHQTQQQARLATHLGQFLGEERKQTDDRLKHG